MWRNRSRAKGTTAYTFWNNQLRYSCCGRIEMWSYYCRSCSYPWFRWDPGKFSLCRSESSNLQIVQRFPIVALLCCLTVRLSWIWNVGPEDCQDWKINLSLILIPITSRIEIPEPGLIYLLLLILKALGDFIPADSWSQNVLKFKQYAIIAC